MNKRLFVLTLLLVGLVPLATAQTSYTTAAEVLQANIEATGGQTAWENVRSIHMNVDVIIESPQGLIMMEGETWRIFPGYMLMKMTSEDMPMANNTTFITPEGGWTESQMGREELADSSEAVQGMMRPMKEEITMLADETLEMLPNEQVNDRDAYVVRTGGEDGTKRYYDTETLRLVAVEVATPMGSAVQQVGNYKEVSGVMIPHEQSMEMASMGMNQTVVTTMLKVNPELTADGLKAMAGGDGQ